MSENQTTSELRRGDVVRARAVGNKTVGNYVIDRAESDLNGAFTTALAHREHGAGKPRLTMFRTSEIRILRSYNQQRR